MKKRLLTVVLMLALLVTAVTIIAQAATTPASSEPVSTLVLPTDVQWINIGTAAEFKTYFGGNGETSENLQNLPGPDEDRITKYYRLTNDITITEDPGSTGFFMNTNSHLLDVYMDLNGKTLTFAHSGTTKQNFLAYDPNGKLTVVNGTITNNITTHNYPGGVFLIQRGCDLELQDVTINDTKTVAFGPASGTNNYKGAVISVESNDASATLTNVTINLSRTTDATANTLGGAIYSLGTLNMTDCSITVDNKNIKVAQVGGLLCHEGTGKLTMTRCNFAGGKAPYGTSVAVRTGGAEVEATDCTFTGGTGRGSFWQISGSLTMNNCDFTGGSGDYGANVFIQDINAKLTDCTFENGTATGQGGNLRYIIDQSTADHTLTLTGCEFTGGRATGTTGATGRGGNLYVTGPKLALVMDDCSFTNGNSGVHGGNVFAGTIASAKLTNCTFTNGVASTSSGQGGSLNLVTTGAVTMDGCSFTGGQGVYGGNANITADSATITDCTFANGTSADGANLRLNVTNAVTIDGGSITANTETAGDLLRVLKGNVSVYGTTLTADVDDSIWLNNGATVTIYTAAIVLADGTRNWYADNAAAVAAYTDGAYLEPAPGELVLTEGNYIVDIGGYTLNITGSGEVTCFDSSNDTFQTFGTATATGPSINTGLVRIGDKTYYTLNDNGTYSSHCVEMKIVTTSLRPSIGGIYFTGRWSCDDTLRPHVDGFGVVVSLAGMPGDDFAETAEMNNRWTVFDKSDFSSGVTKTGVMVSGIVKSDRKDLSLNASYGKMPVHAKAYITIDGQNYTGLGKSYSLYDIMQVFSNNMTTYASHAQTLTNFMTHWRAYGLTGEGWDSLDFSVS